MTNNQNMASVVNPQKRDSPLPGSVGHQHHARAEEHRENGHHFRAEERMLDRPKSDVERSRMGIEQRRRRELIGPGESDDVHRQDAQEGDAPQHVQRFQPALSLDRSRIWPFRVLEQSTRIRDSVLRLRRVIQSGIAPIARPGHKKYIAS
jgi:hypothetical protein